MMRVSASFLVLCAVIIEREVSATCGGGIPNQPQPGETHRSSIMVDDPNLGQVRRTTFEGERDQSEIIESLQG